MNLWSVLSSGRSSRCLSRCDPGAAARSGLSPRRAIRHISPIDGLLRGLLLASSLLSVAAAASGERSLSVTASAYNSTAAQTEGDPALGAWGDRLETGMKAIAVSRDLIELGLDHNTRVQIEGLQGDYVVLDKMNKRWRRKIDVYMGNDVETALDWGSREVTISWTPDEPGEVKP